MRSTSDTMATKTVMTKVMLKIYDDYEKYIKDEWKKPIIKRDLYHHWVESMETDWETLRKAYRHITTKFLVDLRLIKSIVDLYTPNQWATLLHMGSSQKDTTNWRLLLKDLRHQWASRPKNHPLRKRNVKV